MYALLGAEQRCLAAQAALGHCLLWGVGVQRDEARGMQTLKNCAGAFCAEAMYVALLVMQRHLVLLLLWRC
jgi:TPR repeat protein